MSQSQTSPPSSAPPTPAKKAHRPAAWLAVLLILLALVFGYFARDFGWGGKGGGAADSNPAASPATDTPKGAEGPAAIAVRVAIRGERCVVDGGEPLLCSAACEAVAQRSTPESPVDLDAAEGTQGAVDTLKRCLALKGYKTVRVDAGESRGR